MAPKLLSMLPALTLIALGSLSGDPAQTPPSTSKPADTGTTRVNTDSEPKQVHRDAEHYVAIRTQVTLQQMPSVMPQLLPKVFAWLGTRGVKPAGPPFIRYLVIDMAKELEIEVGVPVATALPGEGRIHAGVLPAGRYATLHYTGRDLIHANAALQAWAKQHGLPFQTWMTRKGSAWRSRVEFYLTDPAAEPDPDRWQTEIAYLVADQKAR